MPPFQLRQFRHSRNKAFTFFHQSFELLSSTCKALSEDRAYFRPPFVDGDELFLKGVDLWSLEAKLLPVFNQFLHPLKCQLWFCIFLLGLSFQRLPSPSFLVLASILLLAS